MARIRSSALHAIAVQSLRRSGFSPSNAEALSRQIILAEELGQKTVGVAHLFDYVDGLVAGRVDGNAIPSLSRPSPAIITIDGNGGLPQAGFDTAFMQFTETAEELGVCVMLQRNVTLCGSLGTYALRIAEAGLVCIGATNGSPLMAGSGSRDAAFCTNPLAFAAPRTDGPPLLIDQSSSATAYVNIRKAADTGDPIPDGWALDKSGAPTNDAAAALEGTLLPFGGTRGGNIALMVEVLAAGLAGANWSLDAPSFFQGSDCPATGLFLLAINPGSDSSGFADRLARQLSRLSDQHQVHIPGEAKHSHRASVADDGIEIDDELLTRLRRAGGALN